MINIAVIGCGHWGPNHIRNFNSFPGSKVVAAADLDEIRLINVSETFPGIRIERNYRQVLEAPEVDAVVIATPSSTHYTIVQDALRAGKHVLCEKPLCETGAEAEELSALARTCDRLLMIGHVFLFNGGISKIKELLNTQELGALHYLSAVRTNLGPIRDQVNVAYDLATHDISIFNWLIGSEPESVTATGASFLQPGIEDVVFISLKYPGNVFASIHTSWLNPKKVRQLTVVGSQKMVTWDDLDIHAPVAIYDKGANVTQDYRNYGEFLRISLWEGDVRLPKLQLEEPLKKQARYFLQAIMDGKLECSDSVFAIGVVRVLEAVRKSLELGGSSVEVEK